MKAKILMVCLGNICRSPLAEGILQSKLSPALVYIDSAGTAGYHVGEQPDSRSIAVAKKYGIDISGQKCRKFSENDFKEFDVIYAMDKSNYRNITSLASTKEELAKVKMILNETDLNIDEVPDPYYGGDDGFEKVFLMLNNACDKIAERFN